MERLTGCSLALCVGPWTVANDVWLHVDTGGEIDTLHQLRVDGPYAGMESVIDQPNGLGDLGGAVDRTRKTADGPIRETKGSVAYDGHDAYEVRVRDAVPPASGSTRSPAELGITLWIDRHSNRPLAVRYGDEGEVWMTEKIVSFVRFPDDAEHHTQLDFTGQG